MNIFVFDIETVPDVETGGRLLGLRDLPEEAVAKAMLSHSKEATGMSFVKHHLQKIIVISALFRYEDSLMLWSLGDKEATEKELIERFFSGIEKYDCTLVSWNGSAFDLPVLHYRSLYHGITAKRYWEHGARDPTFKFNNYLGRYHQRHVDLMDMLAGYQPKAFARLDEAAALIGLPGKMGLTGDKVLDHYLMRDLQSIRDYCEIDVLNTYLIFLRFQLMRGYLTPVHYEQEIEKVKEKLRDEVGHLNAFLKSWES